MRGFEPQAFSGAVIEPIHGQLDVRYSDAIKVHFLRKELANQTVHVFVCTAFPRCIGMGKVEVRIQGCGDALMLSKLFAIVRGQRVDTVSKRCQVSETAWAVLNGTWAIMG